MFAFAGLQLNTLKQMEWIQIFQEKHDEINSIGILNHLSVTILILTDDQF